MSAIQVPSLLLLMPAIYCQEEGSDPFSTGKESSTALQLSCKNCLSLQPPPFLPDSAYRRHNTHGFT